MDYQQYFKKTYPGIIPHEIIALDNAIFASCNLAFDYDGRCIDDELCAVFCKQIKYAYKLVGPFEERLEADIKELEGNNGYSFFYDIDDMHRKAFYSMQTIIEEYHRYLPYVIEDKNEVEDLEGQYINLKSTSPENHIAGLQQEKIIKDQDSAHEGWYINILRSKILPKSEDQNEINERLYNNLEKMYKELGDRITCPKDLFIYRFSGLGTAHNPSEKILWNSDIVLLGHIIRCLTSDQKHWPKGMTRYAEFFQTKSGKKINLATAKHQDVQDFERQKDSLSAGFVKAVEILKDRSGFVNVEFTSKRR